MKRVLLLAFLFCSLLPAQVETARIIGTVKDQTGALVPAAAITITNLETNIATQTATPPGRQL